MSGSNDEDDAIPVAVAEAVPSEPFGGFGPSGGMPIHLQSSGGSGSTAVGYGGGSPGGGGEQVLMMPCSYLTRAHIL